MFIFGKGVQAGVIGKVPDLTKANVEMQYDYRVIYANIMKDWLLVPDNRLNEIFPGIMTAQGTSDGVVFKTLPVAQQEIVTGINNFVDSRFALDDCFPNPARDKTTVRFRVNHSQHVSIRLYDAAGQEVAVLANAAYEPGVHEVETNVSHLRSGLYKLDMRTGLFRDSKSLVVIR